MTLPDFLQPDSPLRPWAFATAACLLACLSPSTRRWGGIILCLVLGVGGIYFGMSYVFDSFMPTV